MSRLGGWSVEFSSIFEIWGNGKCSGGGKFHAARKSILFRCKIDPHVFLEISPQIPWHVKYLIYEFSLLFPHVSLFPTSTSCSVSCWFEKMQTQKQTFNCTEGLVGADQGRLKFTNISAIPAKSEVRIQPNISQKVREHLKRLLVAKNSKSGHKMHFFSCRQILSVFSISNALKPALKLNSNAFTHLKHSDCIF